MAGADVLADALAATPSDPASAFRNYERVHRKLVDAKQRGIGLTSQFLIPANSAGIVTRNATLRAWSAFRKW